MIPYGRQIITVDDINAVVKTLESDYLTQGPTLNVFEDKVSSYCSSKYSISCNSASSALHCAYIAVGLGPGDRLWTSANTFAATANMAIHCGATVDFIDIDDKTYNMSIEQLETKLIDAKRKNCLPKVVVPVHFAGQSCDMEEIYRLSQSFGFKVIEDASHAIGAQYKDEPVGSCRYSDITVFSFHPVKIITTGEGGVAVTNELNFAKKMREFRTHGIVTKRDEFTGTLENELWNYQQTSIGMNYRMTEIQAALGSSQIDRLDEYVKIRRAKANFYFEELGHIAEIKLPFQSPSALSSFHLFPILINKSSKLNTRNRVYKFLQEAKIGVNLHYIPVYRHPFYKNLGFQVGYCPNSENYFQSTISLPLHPALSQQEQNYIIEKLIAGLS